MRKRSLAREFALKVLYQKEITQRPIDQAIEWFWKNEPAVENEVRLFADRLTQGVEQKLKTIDEKISQYAANWQLKRMAVIDKNILRLGVFELLFAPDIPPVVAINEAVELAKKFGDLESSKFVNGILDKIHKSEITAPPKDQS